uniref:Putative ovule protein n=1 Tax=Solanum chacoense TaxID=4108 RepID=A0A0V0GNT0_SOLCH
MNFFITMQLSKHNKQQTITRFNYNKMKSHKWRVIPYPCLMERLFPETLDSSTTNQSSYEK